MQPALDEKEIYGVLPKLVMNNMMEIINRLVDNPNLKRTKTVTAKPYYWYARIDGWQCRNWLTKEKW
jgi:hypothetical protein